MKLLLKIKKPITLLLSAFLVIFCFLFQVFKFNDSDFRFISLRELDYFGPHILCVHVFAATVVDNEYFRCL